MYRKLFGMFPFVYHLCSCMIHVSCYVSFSAIVNGRAPQAQVCANYSTNLDQNCWHFTKCLSDKMCSLKCICSVLMV